MIWGLGAGLGVIKRKTKTIGVISQFEKRKMNIFTKNFVKILIKQK